MRRRFQLLSMILAMRLCVGSAARATAAGVSRTVPSETTFDATLVAGALLPMDILESSVQLSDPVAKEQPLFAAPRRTSMKLGVETLALGTVTPTLVGLGRQARRLR